MIKLLAAVLAAWGVAGGALAETQSYTVIANGEKVGHLKADVQGSTVLVDYFVDNNGRGPKVKERVELGPDGAPLTWTIDGASLFGSPVHERYAWASGTAEWTSQADQGRVAAPRPALYVSADGSPWITSVYVKALLKAPNRTLPVLPSGSLRLQEARRITLGEGASAIPLTVYELSGVDLDPDYVLVDDKGEFFGFLGGLVREGAERHEPTLRRIRQEVALQQALEAQKKLAHRFPGPVRIRNVRIFDPKTMKTGPLSQVVVYGDTIALVTPESSAPVPAGETVIDGQGGTLLPGLHDMHAHTSLSGNLFYLAAGVTATRDQGNDNERLLEYLALIDRGELAGPRIVRNGFLEGRSPFSARNGFVVDSLAEGLEKVRWYADHGYWQIKIYNSMNPDWVAPLAAEAHRLGLGVTGHVPAFSSPDRVMRDGYDDIAHINQLMLGWILAPTEDTRTPLRLTGMARGKDLDLNSARVRTTVALMKRENVALDTTAMILERLMLQRAGRFLAADTPYVEHMPIAYQRSRKRSFVTINTPQDDADYQAGYAKVLQVLKLLDDNGVQLLPGTDDGTGFSLHRELETYVAAGIPAGKTLRLATLDAERYFGRDQRLGSIERGKLADFFLVEGDPARNISDVRRVRMTMRGGVAYYPAEIYQHLNVRPFAPPPPVAPPPASAARAEASAPAAHAHD